MDDLRYRLTLALSLKKMKPIELSNLTGIPKSTISQYMKGTICPKQDRIYLLAKALDVSEAWLIGYDINPNRNDSLENTLTQRDKVLLAYMHKFSEKEQDTIINIAKSFAESNGTEV